VCRMEECGLDCSGLGLAGRWSKSYDMEFPLLPSVDTGVAPSSVRINRGCCWLHQAKCYHPTCRAESHSITTFRSNFCPVQSYERSYGSYTVRNFIICSKIFKTFEQYIPIVFINSHKHNCIRGYVV
jgi:hypothetical protein